MHWGRRSAAAAAAARRSAAAQLLVWHRRRRHETQHGQLRQRGRRWPQPCWCRLRGQLAQQRRRRRRAAQCSRTPKTRLVSTLLWNFRAWGRGGFAGGKRTKCPSTCVRMNKYIQVNQIEKRPFRETKNKRPSCVGRCTRLSPSLSLSSTTQISTHPCKRRMVTR